MALDSSSATSTTTRIAVYNADDPATPLLTVNMANVTKLSDSNYLMWSRQIKALLEGHELHTFLEMSDNIPLPILTTNGVASPNPAYLPWLRQDRLLYNALIGAISVSVQPLVASATTTHEVWSTLSQTFGTPTRGHIKQLKLQIKTASMALKQSVNICV